MLLAQAPHKDGGVVFLGCDGYLVSVMETLHSDPTAFAGTNLALL